MYNGHIHIFNSKCVPDDFLKVGIPGARYDKYAGRIKTLLESTRGRRLIRFLLAHGKRKSKIMRLLTFFDVGVESSQRRIFERINQVYHGYDSKYFVLTLNMDYMTNAPGRHVRFETQVIEALQLKRSYPDQLLVFLSCDPRHKKGKALRDWFRRYYEEGKVAGIKLYPALGFFPFDPAFEDLFDYASQHHIPLITHTTRTGSFYIGSNVRQLAGKQPPSFNAAHPVMPKIYSRLGRYYDSTHRNLQLNDYYCNVFSHPENYLPMIETFKGLKLCFAHYGGTGELLRQTPDFMLGLENDATVNWTDLIRRYMIDYPNVYTDISYTLADTRTHIEFVRDMQHPVLQQKILFGTDYFMEEQEKTEADVFADFRESFLNDRLAYTRLTQTNPYNFLYTPAV